MSNRSWVTLATNDSYGLGALVLAHSLRRAGSVYPAVVLITPSVTEAMRERLRAVFSEVVTVDVLDSRDAAHLALLQRPELGITFTKIHCWNLTQYEKCVFLDADILVVQNCDELFEREELSAAPDVGWPDCFNSGVFVFKPSSETFASLIKFAQERGSFDGGDQGLLNSFFSDWAHGDINKHLPFLYNVTSAAFYSYLPALKHYGQNLKVIHFIGAAKPWLQQFNWESRQVDAPEHLREFLQLWWDLFVPQVHAQLDVTMSGVAGNFARVALGGGNEAIDDLTRRQGWEAGNIDYMGVDAFENIWAKISQTLSQPRSSPPKQSPPRDPTPPAPQPSAVSDKPVTEEIEVAKEALPVEAPVPSNEPAATETIVSVLSEVPAPVVPAPVEEVITAKSVATTEIPTPSETPAVASAPVESETPSQVIVPDVVSDVAKAVEVAPAPTETSPAAEPTIDSKPVEQIPAPVEAAVTEAPVRVEATAPIEAKGPVEIATPTDATPSVETTDPVNVTVETAATVEGTAPAEAALPVEAAAPLEIPESEVPVPLEPVAPVKVAAPLEIPESEVPVPLEVVSLLEAAAPIEVSESEVPVPVASIDQSLVPKEAETDVKKTETPEMKLTPSGKTAKAPKSEEAVKVAPVSPAPAEAAGSPAVPEATPEKVSADVSTDSPPLAHTPSKEETPAVPAAKTAERRKPAGKLQLGPPAAPDPLPTPDSELEDAAALAQSIIASELRTPTVTAPSPVVASPPAAPESTRLAVDEPKIPTPPVKVALSQIGVKPTKGKSSTAAQIESSVTEKAEPAPKPEVAPASATATTTPAAPAAPAEAPAPKKKVVKKVVKKDGAGGADAPVPPPRKKEKKPKEK